MPVSLAVRRLDVDAISCGVVNPTKMPAAELYREGGKYFPFPMVSPTVVLLPDRCLCPLCDSLLWHSNRMIRVVTVTLLTINWLPVLLAKLKTLHSKTQFNLANLCSVIYSILVTSIMVFSRLCVWGNFLFGLIN